MRHFKLARAILAISFATVAFPMLPAFGSIATSSNSPWTSASQTAPTSLGVFTILNEGSANANALTVLYGASSEGDALITYYASSPDMNVVSLGNSQYEIVETLGGRCMTNNGVGLTVTITTCAANQKQLFALVPQLFALVPQSDGSFVIQSASGVCISSPGAGTAVEAQTCNSSLSQNWTFSGSAPLNLGTTTTTSSSSTTSSSTPTSGSTTTSMPTSGSTTTTSPTTTSTTVSLGVFSVLNEGSANANALTVLCGASSEGDALITYYASPPDMNVVSLGNSQYEIVETLGGRCMTNNGIGLTVTITTCAANQKQLFALVPQSDGSFVIQSASGVCISSPGAGNAVQAQTCNSSLSQNWTFSGSAPLNLGTIPASSTLSAVPAGYHLTFDDEFKSLNISDTNGAGTNWYTHTIQCCMGDSATPPAPTYMAGLSDGPGKDPYSLLSGEGLDIRLEKTNGAWYSGVLATVDGNGKGFAQQYGYFEMKANFPSGLGTWPAFWLLNSAHLTQGSPSGEIDVVEAYMQFPTTVDTTLHDYSTGISVGTHPSPVSTNMSNGFHTYGMLWTVSTMTFYFDGTQIWQVPTPAIMNQPYYPIIDLGLGGGWPTNQTPQQSDMIVQYVRVYAP